MRRVIANFFAFACLALFIVVGFFWVRSLLRADHLRHADASSMRGVLCSRGDVALYSYDWTGFEVSDSPGRTPGWTPGWTRESGAPIDIPAEYRSTAAHHRQFLGFWFFRNSELPQAPGQTHGQTLPGWSLVLPLWFLALVFFLVPLGRLLRWRRAMRRRPLPPRDPAGAKPGKPV